MTFKFTLKTLTGSQFLMSYGRSFQVSTAVINSCLYKTRCLTGSQCSLISAGVICSNLSTQLLLMYSIHAAVSWSCSQSCQQTMSCNSLASSRLCCRRQYWQYRQEGTGAHGAVRVCESSKLYTTCWSNVRCQSNVTPRLLIVDDGSTTAPETCSDGTSSTDCRRLPVVSRIASDLLGFSCRPLSSNH